MNRKGMEQRWRTIEGELSIYLFIEFWIHRILIQPNIVFNEKDENYREGTMKETGEKNDVKALMFPLILSHDGAVHKDIVRRWKDFSPDNQSDWVRMAQSVLRYNAVIVGKFFNKGSLVSESLRKDHSEEFTEQPEGPPERIPNAENRTATF